MKLFLNDKNILIRSNLCQQCSSKLMLGEAYPIIYLVAVTLTDVYQGEEEHQQGRAIATKLKNIAAHVWEGPRIAPSMRESVTLGPLSACHLFLCGMYTFIMLCVPVIDY